MEYFTAKYWYIILPLIGYIVWQARLENKVKANEEDIKILKEEKKDEIKDINLKLDSMNNKLNELCISFAELAGYMKRCNEEKK